MLIVTAVGNSSGAVRTAFQTSFGRSEKENYLLQNLYSVKLNTYLLETLHACLNYPFTFSGSNFVQNKKFCFISYIT